LTVLLGDELVLITTISRSGKYPEAITALQQAVQSQPDFVPGWLYLSGGYTGSNQLGEALAAINKAIQLQPNNPNLYNEKYVVLSDLKRYREADAAINKAIELSPRTVFYNNRGVVRNDLGDKQGAIDDYNQALKFNPNLTQAYYNRGVVHLQLGDKRKAREDLQRAAQLFMAQGNTALYEKAMGLLKGL